MNFFHLKRIKSLNKLSTPAQHSSSFPVPVPRPDRGVYCRDGNNIVVPSLVFYKIDSRLTKTQR